jgi:GntR family transcriptional regulator
MKTATTARVNPYDVVPKYHQLYDILRQKINSGDWKPHEAIPSERELETLYNVSRTTVRQAINLLVNDGFLYREHGRGTFVARPKLQHSLHLLTSFTDDMRQRGLQPGQRLLNLEYVAPSAWVRQRLELPPEMDEVLKVERLRLGDDEPVGIHVAYLPLDPDQALTAQDLDEAGSLYELLESRFNLIPVEADETLEATAANEREATLLHVPVGSPLLLIERTTWSQQHRPVEFVKMLYRADRYKYGIHITR